MDKILLHNCVFKLHVGATKKERAKKQRIEMDVTLFFDIKKAARADALAQTVCYADVHKALDISLASCDFVLIETIAESSAALILKKFPITTVTVQVRKPGALKKKSVEYAGVEITRTLNVLE